MVANLARLCGVERRMEETLQEPEGFCSLREGQRALRCIVTPLQPVSAGILLRAVGDVCEAWRI